MDDNGAKLHNDLEMDSETGANSLDDVDGSIETEYNLEVDGRLYHLDDKLNHGNRQSASAPLKLFLSGYYFKKRVQKRVAIKIEHIDESSPDGEPERLLTENLSYQRLKGGVKGTPEKHGYETKIDDCGILVIDLLGPSLADLITFVKGKTGCPKLSLKTVLIIADQLLRTLRRIHRRGLVHQDIKPENIAIGLAGDQNRFYIFDFDVACQVGGPPNRSFVGTYPFASVGAHQNHVPCPADDLESLLYVLILMAQGTLPWFNALDVDEVHRHKQSISSEDLCSGLPAAFTDYHRRIRRSGALTERDYNILIDGFKNYFAKNFRWGYDDFEWIVEARKEMEAGGVSTSLDRSHEQSEHEF